MDGSLKKTCRWREHRDRRRMQNTLAQQGYIAFLIVQGETFLKSVLCGGSERKGQNVAQIGRAAAVKVKE